MGQRAYIRQACGKFGEHERSVRVPRGLAESNSNFLSALNYNIAKLENYNEIQAKLTIAMVSARGFALSFTAASRLCPTETSC